VAEDVPARGQAHYPGYFWSETTGGHVNPAQSLDLAPDATEVNPGIQAEQALRLAMAQDRLRMVIKSGAGPATLAAWNPAVPQIAVTAPYGTIALWNSDTGRACARLSIAGQCRGGSGIAVKTRSGS
jgi:hypothetical protein